MTPSPHKPADAPSRALWQPDPIEQRDAIETLLASPINHEARAVLHLRGEELARKAA